MADLNTKILSSERRNYLMKKIGFLFPLWQDSNDNVEPHGQARMVQNVVGAVMAVMMTNLQGCEQGCDMVGTRAISTSMWTWFGTVSFPLASLIPILGSFFSVITYLQLRVSKLSKELDKYKMVWKEIGNVMKLQKHEDLFCNDAGHGADAAHGGEEQEGGETESEAADDELPDAETE